MSAWFGAVYAVTEAAISTSVLSFEMTKSSHYEATGATNLKQRLARLVQHLYDIGLAVLFATITR